MTRDRVCGLSPGGGLPLQSVTQRKDLFLTLALPVSLLKVGLGFRAGWC